VPRELIPIVMFNVAGIVLLAFSPIGRAIARRIGGASADADETAALRDEVADLRHELDQVHSRMAQLDQVQERLDFAERVMAQGKDRGALPGAR
jgi:hypothetical protein